MIRVIVPLILTAIMVFTIVDLVTIDNSRVRYLPKMVWILFAIFLSLIGCLLWFFLGREPAAAGNHGRYTDGPPPRAPRPSRSGPSAPDDDPEFLKRLNREKEQQERIRELEKRLSELDDDKAAD